MHTADNARAVCPNCSTEIQGPFCATCGQAQKELKKFFWTLAADALEDVFRPDSRASRTLFALFFRPGYLTREYFVGRRARYVQPVRLYLVISFAFFFLLPLLGELYPKTVSSDLVFAPETSTTAQADADADDSDTDNPADSDGAGLEADDLDDINVNFAWLTDKENEQLSYKLRHQVAVALEELEDNPAALMTEFMDLMSAVMFFILPLFAIFLKLLYLGSGVYYAEHLLLAIHNHCFLFIALIVSSILAIGEGTWLSVITDPLDTALTLWIPIYIFLSMRVVYGQGLGVTLLKFSILSLCYWVLTLTGFMTGVMVEVMRL